MKSFSFTQWIRHRFATRPARISPRKMSPRSLVIETLEDRAMLSPLLSDDPSYIIGEDGILNGTSVLLNDLLVNLNSASLVSNVTNGVLDFNSDGTFEYTPNPNFSGVDTFTYNALDLLGILGLFPATVTITVSPLNDLPIANPLSTSTVEDTPLTGTLTGLDIDLDLLTFAVGSVLPTNGLVNINPNGSFSYTPNPNFSGPDSFTFTVSDGLLLSLSAVVSINVTPANDGPTANAASLTTNEDTPLTGLLTGSDPDGNPLSFLAGAVSPVNGSFVINPNGTFNYVPNLNFNGTDAFSFLVNDGTTSSTESLISISIGAVNDLPFGTLISLTTPEDTILSTTLSALDVDGDLLSFLLGTVVPLDGELNLGLAGGITYTPDANFNGTDSFTFTVSDGILTSTQIIVSINVTPVNDAPLAVLLGVSTAEDTPVSGNLLGLDVDGDLLTYQPGSVSPEHGSVVINSDGTFTYSPALNFHGSDSFSFRVSDGVLLSLESTVTVTVTAVNDTPVANSASVSATEDTPLTGTLTGSDSDGDSITFLAGAIAPAHGTVIINSNGSYTYTAAANYHGSDSFSFKVSDGTATSGDATITITVTAVNDAPTGNPGSATATEDTVLSGRLTGSDIDGDELTFAVGALAPAHGTLTLNPDGTYTYTPAANYNGPDRFSFHVNDGTTTSADATVTLSVVAVNDAPVVTPIALNTVEDTPLVGTLTGSDIEGSPLVFSAGGIAPSQGTVTINSDGTFTYTPAANFNGTDSFSVRVSDGVATSADTTIAVSVSAVNDAPTVNVVTINAVEDTPINGTLTGSDPEGTPLVFSLGSVTPTRGTVTVNANGTFTYTAAANFNGTDSFSVRASDGVATSADTTLTLVVAAVNDAPIANSATLTPTEDTPLSTNLSATDVDGDPLTYLIGSILPQHGIVSISPTGAIVYTPAANFVGTDTFSFKVTDGVTTSPESSITMTITAVNDAPVANPANFNSLFNTPFTGQLTGIDVDGDSITYAAGTILPAHGTIAVASNGQFIYTPDIGYSGTDSFSFRTSDGTLNSSQATVTLNVSGPGGSANQTPVATGATLATAEDTPLSGILTAADADGDPLTFQAGTIIPTHGTVTVSANGGFLYTPNANFFGTDSFSFFVNDGTVTSIAAVVNITITSTNDAPVGDSATVIVRKNTPRTGTLVANDVDGNTITYTAGTTVPAHGTVVINSNGSFTYTPETDYVGLDSFSFRVSDGTATGAEAVIFLDVNDVNVAPVAVPASFAIAVNTVLTGTLNASDANGDALTFQAGTVNSAHGTLVIHPNGTFTYTPASGYVGPDSFSFKVSDGLVESNEATVSLTVATLSNNLVAIPVNLTITEDAVVAGRLTGTSSGSLPLTFLAGKVASSHGVVTLNADGQFTYTPNQNFFGTDSFSFSVVSGSEMSAEATASITVTSVNDAPRMTNGSIQGQEDILLSGTVAPLAEDVDGDTITFELLGAPEHGVLTLAIDGSFTYQPDANYNGPDSFTVRATDGLGTSNIATITLNLGAVDDAFRVVLPSPNTTIGRGKKLNFIDSAAFVTDPDSEVNYANASIRVSITAGGHRKDKLLVTPKRGSGSSAFHKGKKVSVQGSFIGKFAKGVRGNPLVINLGANSTEAAVNSILKSIGLQSKKKGASGPRTIQVDVSAGGNLATSTKIVNVQ